MQPFRPRLLRYHGVADVGGTRLKLYSLAHDDALPVWDAFRDGFALAGPRVPLPDDAQGRPGLGFVVAHRGATLDYFVLAWWDRENELPIRVFVGRPEAGEPWRPARDGESVCVWDLDVVWSERQAYVQTMLTRHNDPEAYLALHAGAPAEAPWAGLFGGWRMVEGETMGR